MSTLIFMQQCLLEQHLSDKPFYNNEVDKEKGGERRQTEWMQTLSQK